MTKVGAFAIGIGHVQIDIGVISIPRQHHAQIERQVFQQTRVDAGRVELFWCRRNDRVQIGKRNQFDFREASMPRTNDDFIQRVDRLL